MTFPFIRTVLLSALIFMVTGLLGCLTSIPAAAQGEYGLTVTMHMHMVPVGHTVLIDYSTGATDQAYDLVLVSSAGSVVARCGQSSTARTCHYTHAVNAPGGTVYYKAVLEQNGSPIAQSLVDAVTWGTLQLTSLEGSKRHLSQGVTLLASMVPARIEAHHYIAIYEIYYAGASQKRHELTACTANVDLGRNGTDTTCMVHVRSPQHGGVHAYKAFVIGPSIEYPNGPAITSNQQNIKWSSGSAASPPPTTQPPAPPVKRKAFSVTFNSLVIQNASGVVQNTFHRNRQLSIVARYTVQNLHASYIRGTIRRVYQIPIKGRFTTASVNSDTIVAVKGTNPPNVHTFTPQVIGPIRIVVDISLGTVFRQRTVDIRITR